ncbi:MAG: DUF1573 domain-containing protein [Flavobacteriales bacterium]
MKHFILLSVLLVCSASVYAQYAELFFEEKLHKFPDTKEGELLTYDFKFINKGEAPLIITNYKAACSCTKAEFSQEPILPGASGIVKVTFDTKGKIAYQDRTVELFSNSKKSPTKIRFKVMVVNEN